MGNEVGFEATVPVAFFVPENIPMQEAFLEGLHKEPGLGRVTLYLNGGNEYAEVGEKLCRVSGFDCIDAHGWPFYRMWNAGILGAEKTVLVLNNDITWTTGALGELVAGLDAAPEDVSITYPRFEPDTRGLAGWCFAIRPEAFRAAGRIDERYQTWFGDDEMTLLLRDAGYRTRAMDVEVWHYLTQTMKHRPDYWEQIFADRNLFESHWGREEVQVEALRQ